MIQLTATVVGLETLEAKWNHGGDRAKARLREAIDRIGLKMLRRVKFGRLSGQSLGVVTGRLRRSINYKFTETGDTLRGSVGTNVVYGAFWELGPKKSTANVRAHVRNMEARSTYLLRKGKQKSGKLASQGIAFVKAHTRDIGNIKARPFLKPELEVMRTEIRERLKAAVVGGLNGR